MQTEILEIRPKDAATLDRLRADIQRIQRDLKKWERLLNGSRVHSGLRAGKGLTKPFGFSARVLVVPTRKSLRSIRGKTGRVLGRAPGQDHWIYTVFIDDQNECWSLAHNELKSIAKPVPKAPACPVGHIRVRVDKQGRGHPVK